MLHFWEGHYSELLSHEGKLSDLDLPNYVYEKVNVIEIAGMEVTEGLKGMKRGQHQARTNAEMVDVAGEIGVRWTKTGGQV